MVENDKPPKRVVTDRPRGILTRSDRELLVNDSDITAQTKRERHRDIRERVYNALFDFWILLDYLPDNDLNQILDLNKGRIFEAKFPAPYSFLYENYRLQPGGFHQPTRFHYQMALTDMVAFVCRCAEAVKGLDSERIVETGMTKFLREYGATATVQIHEAALEELWKKFRRGELNLKEVQWLLEADSEQLQTEGDELMEKFRQSNEESDGPPEWMIERMNESNS